MQTVITTSVVTGVQLREDMDKGVFDRFKSLPIARIAPLAGALLADTVRYAIATVLTLVMGYIMGYRPGGGLGHVASAALLVIVCAWAISWIFAFFGVIARTASSVQGMSMMVLFPLTFLSNAFVPINTMPTWLQWFGNINPVSHLIAAVRDLANNGVVGRDLVVFPYRRRRHCSGLRTAYCTATCAGHKICPVQGLECFFEDKTSTSWSPLDTVCRLLDQKKGQCSAAAEHWPFSFVPSMGCILG